MHVCLCVGYVHIYIYIYTSVFSERERKCVVYNIFRVYGKFENTQAHRCGNNNKLKNSKSGKVKETSMTITCEHECMGSRRKR